MLLRVTIWENQDVSQHRRKVERDQEAGEESSPNSITTQEEGRGERAGRKAVRQRDGQFTFTCVCPCVCLCICVCMNVCEYV